ncbi:MAG: GNAT family N-acetyltransferase [Planctomycetota bacterium]
MTVERGIAERIPDEPESAVARALASRGARSVEWAGGGVVVATDVELVAGFGAPPPDSSVALEAALDGAAGAEVHVPGPELAAWFDAIGAEDLGVRALLLTRSPGAPPLREPAHETVALTGPGDALLDSLPRALRQELRALRPFPPAFGALAGGALVSVAYAFLRSERHTDVSIDTVPAFRRSGFGRAAATALVASEEAAGRTVLWGARESNRASLALAAVLGFEHVGTLHLGALRP